MAKYLYILLRGVDRLRRRMLKSGTVKLASLYKITICGNRRLSLRKTLFVRITRSSSPLMICLCTLRFYVDVLTPSTNFIGFIEFYGVIFHELAAVFHRLLILMGPFFFRTIYLLTLIYIYGVFNIK